MSHEEDEFLYSSCSDEDDVNWESVETKDNKESNTLGNTVLQHVDYHTEQDINKDIYEKVSDTSDTIVNEDHWDKINATLQQQYEEEIGNTTNKRKRASPRMPRLSKDDKRNELIFHKAHLLLLLAMHAKWNAICNSLVLQGLLLSISNGIMEFNDLIQQYQLKYSLERLTQWFHTIFRIKSAKQKASMEINDLPLPENIYNDNYITEARLIQVFFNRTGDSLELSLLFIILCRALQLNCRYVAALDGYAFHQKKSRGAQIMAQGMKHLEIWSEVLDPSSKSKTFKWIPVHSVQKIIDPRNGELEDEIRPAYVGPFVYIVAITSSGAALDVTPRYVNQWSKTAGLRMADEWFSTIVRTNFTAVFSVASSFETVQLNEEIQMLEAKKTDEIFPSTLEGFKQHQRYCLESQLNTRECIYPRTIVGTYQGLPVFLRSSIKKLATIKEWRQLGREVNEVERSNPIKKLGLDHIEEKHSRYKPLYGEWQTSAVVPLAIVDGKLPRNQHGNIEIWSSAHVPIGAVHITLPRIKQTAKKLGLEFVDAVVGFEMKQNYSFNKKLNPKFDGIIVHAEKESLLVDAHAAMQNELIEQAIERNVKLILSRWKRLVTRLLLKDRLNQEYGEV